MKKIFLIVCLVLHIVVKGFSQCTSCGDSIKAVQMTSDPNLIMPQLNNLDPCIYPDQEHANTFDWTQGSYLINKPNIASSSILSPFTGYISDELLDGYLFTETDDNNQNLVPLNRPEDGWELIKQDLGYFWDPNGYGKNGNTSTLVPVTGGGSNVAYLLMYNKYSSVLRVIATIPGYASNISIAQEISIQLSFLAKTNNGAVNWYPTGLFNHYSQDKTPSGVLHNVSQSLDVPVYTPQVVAATYWPGTPASWFFGDFQVAYDPCTCNNPSALQVEFFATSSASINLSGGFYGGATPITDVNWSTNNPVTWLASYANTASATSTASAPVAGMQTYGYISNLINEYNSQVTNYNGAIAQQAAVAKAMQDVGTAMGVIADAAIVAGEAGLFDDKTSPTKFPPIQPTVNKPVSSQSSSNTSNPLKMEDQASSGSDAPNTSEATGNGVAAGINAGALVVDYLSSSGATPTQPAMPYVIQGEVVMSGSATFSSTVNGSSFSFANPGSNSNGLFYPEFSGVCGAPGGDCSTFTGTNSYSSVENHNYFSPVLLGYVYYNQPLGNFAVLNKPSIRMNNGVFAECPPYNGTNPCYTALTYYGFVFDGTSLKYAFNPAVPVDETHSQIYASIVANVVFNSAADATLMINGNNGFYGDYFTTSFLSQVDATHYQITSDPLPLECIGSVTPYFGTTTSAQWSVESTYLKLSAILLFAPDPKYPSNTDPHLRTLITTYPATTVIDKTLIPQNFDPTFIAGYGSPYEGPTGSASPTIGATEYSIYDGNSLVTNIAAAAEITIDGTQTMDATVQQVNFYSDQEVQVIGETQLLSGTNASINLYSNYMPNQLICRSYPVNAVHNSYASAYCQSNNNPAYVYQANTYVSGVSGTTSRVQEEEYSLSQIAKASTLIVSPNPASNQVTMTCQVSKQAETKLYIVDILGNVVKNVFDITPQASSTLQQVVDITGLQAGIYFCVLDAEGHKEVQKMVVVN